jgi:hypothetical protein
MSTPPRGTAVLEVFHAGRACLGIDERDLKILALGRDSRGEGRDCADRWDPGEAGLLEHRLHRLDIGARGLDERVLEAIGEDLLACDLGDAGRARSVGIEAGRRWEGEDRGDFPLRCCRGLLGGLAGG